MLWHSTYCCRLGEGTLRLPCPCVFLELNHLPDPGSGGISPFFRVPITTRLCLVLCRSVADFWGLPACISTHKLYCCRQFDCPCSLTAIFQLLVICSDRFRPFLLFLQITGGKLWLAEWLCDSGVNVWVALSDFASAWLDPRATCNLRVGFWGACQPLLGLQAHKEEETAVTKGENSFRITSSLSIST